VEVDPGRIAENYSLNFLYISNTDGDNPLLACIFFFPGEVGKQDIEDSNPGHAPSQTLFHMLVT
jgi:hypothetical protein